MPTPIDPKRLPRLRAARKRFEADEKAPQQKLAEIYGVANSRFTTLAKRFPNFPPAERHGDKTHWFPAVAAIDSMIAYCTGHTARKAAVSVRAAQILGESTKEAAEAEPELPPLGPSELRQMAATATMQFRLAVEKREFVRADVVAHSVRSLFTTIQRAVSTLPSEIDPNGELPPLMRGRLEAASSAALERMHREIAGLISDEQLSNAA